MLCCQRSKVPPEQQTNLPGTQTTLCKALCARQMMCRIPANDTHAAQVCCLVALMYGLIVLMCCAQSAGLATTVALTSSAVFCMHCWLQQDQAASLHPPLMYACILALVLLPWDVAFKVRTIWFFNSSEFVMQRSLL